MRNMEERLQKIISRAGIASRRAAEKIILEGRVTVEGEAVTELGRKCDPDRQVVCVDGSGAACVFPAQQAQGVPVHGE